jgi:hypothetical protein
VSDEFELAEAAPSLQERYAITGPVPIRPRDAGGLADGSIEPARLCSSLRDYVSTRPEWAPAFRPVIAGVAVDAGQAALEAGDWDACADFAAVILEERPGDQEATAMLVHALHGGRQYVRAADLGDELLEKTDNVDPSLVVCTAEAYEKSARVTHALRLLDRYITEDPEQDAYPRARTAIVERLAAAADADQLATPPRLTTNRDAGGKQPARRPAVVADDRPPADTIAVAADAAVEGSSRSWSVLIVLAGLLAGAGVAVVVLALL